MEKFKVKQTDLVGDIKYFPVEVVQKMVDYQVKQGNEADVRVFQKDRYADCNKGGFDWEDTPEGDDFWTKVASERDFDRFYKVYPQEEAKEEEQPKPAPDIPEGLRPFDVEKAKAGAEIVTRLGYPARIICYDRLDGGEYTLVGLVREKGCRDVEDLHIYNKSGKWSEKETKFDLFIKPTKKTGWVNIYKSDGGSIYATEVYSSYEEAEDAHGTNYTATCKIEWEE